VRITYSIQTKADAFARNNMPKWNHAYGMQSFVTYETGSLLDRIVGQFKQITPNIIATCMCEYTRTWDLDW
jgi:hypothetical protein